MKPETLKRANEITARIEAIDNFLSSCSKTFYPESIREKQELQTPIRITLVFDGDEDEMHNTAPIDRELLTKVTRRIYDGLETERAFLQEELEKL